MIRGTRIGIRKALKIAETYDLPSLGSWANEVRNSLNDPKVVTYAVDRNINYTNICISKCRFCAFCKDKGSQEGYVLDTETLQEKIRATRERGGTHILLQGGLNPELPFSYHLTMVRTIRDSGLMVHGYSPPEILFFSEIYQRPVNHILSALKDAGLSSIPGGGAEILSNRVRSLLSPRKADTQKYLSIMEEAHKIGLRTTATMMFGHIETWVQRLVHLKLIRDLQDRTGGFTAFICWPYQAWKGFLPGRSTHPAEYLRMLAIARIFLDNILHIQASWVTQGRKVAQIALFFGADDMGSTMMEENVVSAAGTSYMLDEMSLRELIRNAGFIPKKRDVLYRVV